MTAYQLFDCDTEEIVGSVIVTKETKLEDAQEAITDAWESFNKLEEYEGDTKCCDEFVTWFNEGFATQIERLYLEDIIIPH